MSTKMRLFVTFVIVSVLGAAAPAAIMHDSVPSSEYEARAALFPSAGFINRLDGGLFEPGGSGVLIDAGDDSGLWVLTAGHVILRSGINPYDGFQFGFGSDQLGNPGRLYTADGWYPHPDYSDNDPWGLTPDLGLLHLSERVLDIEPALRFRGTDQAGTLLTRVGHGTPGTASGGLGVYDGIERGANNVGYRFGLVGGLVSTDYWMTRFTPFGELYYQELGAMGSPGDSGGANFSFIGGDMQLVGITSFVRGDYGYYGLTGSLRVSLYNNWIDDVIANHAPEPSSLILLLVGAAVLPRRRPR